MLSWFSVYCSCCVVFANLQHNSSSAEKSSNQQPYCTCRYKLLPVRFITYSSNTHSNRCRFKFSCSSKCPFILLTMVIEVHRYTVSYIYLSIAAHLTDLLCRSLCCKYSHYNVVHNICACCSSSSHAFPNYVQIVPPFVVMPQFVLAP